MAYKVLKFTIGGLETRIFLMQFNHQPAGGSKRFQRVRAFSFVEVLIASGMGLFIFAALFYGLANGLTLLDVTRQNLRATQIVLSRMEGLRLCAWGNGTNQASQVFNTTIIPTTFTDYFYPVGLNGVTNLGVAFYGTMVVQSNITLNPSASYSSKMAMVTISLRWTNSGYGNHQLAHSQSMSTYVSQSGIQNYIYTH
jgi:hypothetical protein